MFCRDLCESSTLLSLSTLAGTNNNDILIADFDYNTVDATQVLGKVG